MAKKPTLTNITAGFASATVYNDNNTAIRDAFDNTLSRDGSTPNSMSADFDLNSNDLLNGGKLNATDIVVGGTSIQAKVDAAAASASAAATSESNAASSATSAASSLDEFDDTYLGAKSSAPTTDNDGNALQDGALYFNTSDTTLYVWDGSQWNATELGKRGEFNVKSYGAVGDGATDDRAAIQAAHDAAEAAGGGVVFYPPGTYLISTATTGATGINWDGDNVHHVGDGRGVSILKLANAADLHMFNIDTVTGGGIRGLEIDGNRANQTAGVHGIRIGTATDFIVEDMYIHDAAMYGIGWSQSGTSTNVHVRRCTIEDTGGDGIDMKNKNDNNVGCSITDVTVIRPGRDSALSEQACIDVRGPVRLNNIDCRDFGDVASTTGIRFRSGEAADAGSPNGKGAHNSSLTNFYVEAGNQTGTIGVDIVARLVQVAAGYIVFCHKGVAVQQREATLSAITVEAGAGGGDFHFKTSTLVTDGDRSVAVGCIARSGSGIGYDIDTNNVQLIGCVARSKDTGIDIDAGADGTRVIGGDVAASTTEISDAGTNSRIKDVFFYTTENWGVAALSPAANGEASITHGLDATPTTASVTFEGDDTKGVQLIALGGAAVTVRIYNLSDGSDVTTGTFNIRWWAQV